MHRAVAHPGVFLVRVTIRDTSAEADSVTVVAGNVTRHTAIGRSHHKVRLSMRVRVHGHMLTVRAVGRPDRLTLSVSMHRVANLPAASHVPGSSGAPSSGTAPGVTVTTTTTTTTTTAGTSGSTGASGTSGPPAPLTAWVPVNPNFKPLSDAAAAADVTPNPETIPANTTANHTMPTAAQLQTFYGTLDYQGHSIIADNPYNQYVTGHYTGTTDDIIQWAAWKWGIPADWLRAQYVQESDWSEAQLGDLRTVDPSWYDDYPPAARVSGTDNQVYETMGISQIKWTPDNQINPGTEPLRWESTAFAADYEAATLRFYFDNPGGLAAKQLTSNYQAGEAWDSLGGWYEPTPWLNSGQLDYISQVQQKLAAKAWIGLGS